MNADERLVELKADLDRLERATYRRESESVEPISPGEGARGLSWADLSGRERIGIVNANVAWGGIGMEEVLEISQCVIEGQTSGEILRGVEPLRIEPVGMEREGMEW